MRSSEERPSVRDDDVELPAIREEDVEARPLQRRAFLGRFGAAAGMAGLLGFAVGCEAVDMCDGDQGGDPLIRDNDASDRARSDADAGDECDSDTLL